MPVIPQPLGPLVAFTPCAPPEPIRHQGRRVALRPLDPAADAKPLFALSHAPSGDPSIWTYLPVGPFPDLKSYRAQLEQQARSVDPLFFTIVAADDSFRGPTGGPTVAAGTALGTLSFLSIVADQGRIEIGHIWFGPSLQRTPAATEAIFLLARHAMDDLGYRRLEWKCNSLNEPSRSAALRYGFIYEGTFAHHMIVKGRSRDTAWFAITDDRWPSLRDAFEAWLAPENFDASGMQVRSLRELTHPA